MDERPLADRLPAESFVTRGKVRNRDHPRPSDRARGRRRPDRAVRRAVSDLVVWGHIHEPVSQVWNGVRYFNPGTAGGIGAPATCGVLSIGKKGLTVEHFGIDEPD
jgi:predicted phosphodiesterase